MAGNRQRKASKEKSQHVGLRYSWLLGVAILLVAGLVVAEYSKPGKQADAGKPGSVDQKPSEAGTLAQQTAATEEHEADSAWVGYSSDGKLYTSTEQAWQDVADADGKFKSWYKSSAAYWGQQEASIKGVLLGYDRLHDADIRDSRRLLIKAFKTAGKDVEADGHKWHAIDCGAGIGRVTKNLLLPLFGTVDVMEPAKHLIDQARQELTGKGLVLPGVPPKHKVGEFFMKGLQEADFDMQKYHLIWMQWCLLYLTDEDLKMLLIKARVGLQPNGILFIKENVADEGFVIDKKDHSITRSREIFEKAFLAAGLMILDHAKQTSFPDGLYSVHMWALTRAPLTCSHLEKQVKEMRAAGELQFPGEKQEDARKKAADLSPHVEL